MEDPVDGGKSKNTQNLLISPIRKTALIDLNLPLSKVSFLPHQLTILK